jgi:hypothetical protein
LVKASHIYIVLCAIELLLIGALFLDSVYLRDRPKSSSQVWASTWGGEGRDYARGIATSEGFLYVTGDTTSYGPGNENVFLLKYSGDGGLIWNRTWGGEGFSMGRGIAAVGGSIYVCGIRYTENRSSSLLIKFDDTGSPVWSKEWRSGSDTYGRSVAVDPSGYIYVAGYTRNRSESQSFLLKYEADGALTWARLFNESESETGWAVTVDDGVYLCSTTGVGAAQAVSTAAPRTRMTLRKLGSDGSLKWSRTWGSGLENYGLAAASQGDRVLQAGFTRLVNGTAFAALLEYTSDGDLIHTRLVGDPPECIAWGLAPAGPYVYLVGQQISPNYMDAKDAYIAKIDGDGDMIWSRIWGGFGDDIARSVAVEDDRVYVAGITYGRGEGGEVFLIAYTSPNPQWSPAALIEPASLAVGAALIMTVALEAVRRGTQRKSRGEP